MTEFRGIKAEYVSGLNCNSCMAFEGGECADFGKNELGSCAGGCFQPASLHDGKHVRVVLTGGRKPSFPIKVVWFRDGLRDDSSRIECHDYIQDGKPFDIIAVERAEEV